MGDINKMIQWMKDREGKVTYSQPNRLGPNSYDCSSAVYFALIAGNFLPTNTLIGNTDSLFRLEGSVLKRISASEARKGDIFVSGYPGGSSGNNGHTGFFLDNQTIIHCTSSLNGIGTTPAKNWMGDYMGLPVYYYRLINQSSGGSEENNRKGMMRMFAYMVEGKPEVYGVWGNKVFHLTSEAMYKDFKNIVLDQTGKECKTYKWKLPNNKSTFDLINLMAEKVNI